MKKEIELIEKDGLVLVSSRVVAQDFGKRHSDVITKIEGKVRPNGVVENGLIQGIEDVREIPSNYFIKNEYLDSYGRLQTEYLLTRDGFSLLVMGFTGKEALQWKLQYIEAFNKMEEMIKSKYQPKLDSYMIDNPIDRAKRWIEEEEERQRLALELEKKQELIEKQVDELTHKEDVIVSLVEDVDLMTKRQRITQIIKFGSNGRISERWNLLYREFETKYHMNVNRRMKRDKENGLFKSYGSKLEYICEVLGMTSQLFDVCVVVFEADYKDMLEYYLNLAKGE